MGRRGFGGGYTESQRAGRPFRARPRGVASRGATIEVALDHLAAVSAEATRRNRRLGTERYEIMNSLGIRLVLGAALCCIGLAACGDRHGPEADPDTPAGRSSTSASAAASVLAPKPSASSSAGAFAAGAGRPVPSGAASASGTAGAEASIAGGVPAPSAAEFRDLVTRLSEPDAEFFSDNFISNETSYLQVARRLGQAAKPGGVYLGVGPEQNFTYIALSRPSLAFVVDIRRGNLILQLLYKAAFDLARSRSELLTLLVGRPYDASAPLLPEADLATVMAHAERLAASDDSYRANHQAILQRLEQGYGLTLDARDRRALEQAHRAFFKDGLDIRFKLKENSARRYPSLRELLTAADPDGEPLGFLARESTFRLVQQMERENRVIPLVGDFAGDHAMPGLAAYLRQARLTVAVFYVSNVEQYLFENGVWSKWRRNIEALPTDADSLFVRCYLDQGRRHPHQLPGQRTATVLQRIADFVARQKDKPYRSMWQVSTDEWLPVEAPDALRR